MGIEFFLMVSLNSLKRLHKPMSLLGVGGLAAMAGVAMGVAQPAQTRSPVAEGGVICICPALQAVQLRQVVSWLAWQAVCA